MTGAGTRLQESEVFVGFKLKLTSLLLLVFILVLSFPSNTSPAAILEKRSDVTELPPEALENSILHDRQLQEHTSEPAGVSDTTTFEPPNENNPIQQITTPTTASSTNGQQSHSSAPNAPVSNAAHAVPHPSMVPSAAISPSNTSESDMLDCFCPIEIITEMTEDGSQERFHQKTQQNKALDQLLALPILKAKDIQKFRQQRKPKFLRTIKGRGKKARKGDLPHIQITEKQLRKLLRRGLKFTYAGQVMDKSQKISPKGRAVLGSALQGQPISTEDELDNLFGRRPRNGHVKAVGNKGVSQKKFQFLYATGRRSEHDRRPVPQGRSEDESDERERRPSGRGAVFSMLRPQDFQQLKKHKHHGNMPHSFARLDEGGEGRFGGSPSSVRNYASRRRQDYKDNDRGSDEYSDSKADSVEPPSWEGNSYNRRKNLRNQRPRQRGPQKSRGRKDKKEQVDYSGQSELSERKPNGRKRNRNNLSGKRRSDEDNSHEDASGKSKTPGMQKSTKRNGNSPPDDYSSEETSKGGSEEKQVRSRKNGASKARRPLQRKSKNAQSTSGEDTQEELESHDNKGKDGKKWRQKSRFRNRKRRPSQNRRQEANECTSGEDQEENRTASHSKQKQGKAKKGSQKSSGPARRRGKQENRNGKYRKKNKCKPKAQKSHAAAKARPRPQQSPENVEAASTEPVNDENSTQQPSEQTADGENSGQEPAEDIDAQQSAEKATEEDENTQKPAEQARDEENNEQNTTENVADEVDMQETTERAEDEINSSQKTTEAVEDEQNGAEQTTEKTEDQDNVEQTTEKVSTVERTTEKAENEDNNLQITPEKGNDEMSNVQQTTQKAKDEVNSESNNVDELPVQSSGVLTTDANVEQPTESPIDAPNNQESKAGQPTEAPVQEAPSLEASAHRDQSSQLEPANNAAGEELDQPTGRAVATSAEATAPASAIQDDVQNDDAVEGSNKEGEDGGDKSDDSSRGEGKDSEETGDESDSHEKKESSAESENSADGVTDQEEKSSKKPAQQTPPAPAKQPGHQTSAALAPPNQPKPVPLVSKSAPPTPKQNNVAAKTLTRPASKPAPVALKTGPNSQKIKPAAVQSSQRIPTRPKTPVVHSPIAKRPVKFSKPIARINTEPAPEPNPASEETNDEPSLEERGKAEVETKKIAKCSTQEGKPKGQGKGKKKKQKGKGRNNDGKKKKGKKNKKGKKKRKKSHDDPGAVGIDSDGNGIANKTDGATALSDSPTKKASKSGPSVKISKKDGQLKRKENRDETGGNKKTSKKEPQSGKSNKKSKKKKNKKKAKKGKKKRKHSERTKRLADEAPSLMKPKKVCICFRRSETPSLAVSLKPQEHQSGNKKPQKAASYVKVGEKRMTAPFTLHVTRKNRPSLKLEFKPLAAL